MGLFTNSCAALLAAYVGLGAGIGLTHAASASATPEVKVLHVGGVELHYVEQGSGVPIIFVHGSVDDYRSFEPQLLPLSPRYRAISYSRRYNFPNARSAPPGNHSALVEAADLALLLKALGAYPAHVVGHSYGAYTALILAMKHPELVRSLVLAEPPLLRWSRLSEHRTGFDKWSPAGLTSVQSCPRRRAGVACDERTTDAVGNSCSPLMLPV